MMPAWVADPGVLRFIVVSSLLLTVLGVQRVWPRRGEASPPGRRWRNVALVVISTIVVHIAVPVSAIELAAQAQVRGIGLLHHAQWPLLLEAALAIVVLDMAIYWQHRWFHVVPVLWRIHRVHHSDTQFEATLGVRFHPAEILLSLLYKFAVIAALGASPSAVAVYEILLTGFSILTHADVAIPFRWDGWLRKLVVTPDWHRVHHSVHRDETDSNYGNFLSLWDRIFRSAVPQPRDGHDGMRIGLDEFREPDTQTLPALLRQPLAGAPSLSIKRQ